ncbi:EcoKI restriction-modification system protein HsdS [Clostridiales bacterium CHKCI006]|nr:EcoKI restriction-modification system protein HsdS [Clostridiales bacterium CHKCI006]
MANSMKPAIRFKGFTDDWEQRKAMDIADYSKGNGYSKSDLVDIGTPIILYGRLYTKYQFAISEVDTFAIPKDGSVYSQGNEVIIPASGETAEDIARASAIEKSGVLLGGDLNILRPFSFINPLFLALAISSGEPQKELAKKAQGKSVVHIHNSDIQEVSISFPTRAEQDRIVAVFRNLDNLITLHQRKCDLLKNTKKSLLEKMFPKNDSLYPEVRFKGFTDAWEQCKLGSMADIVGGGTPSTNISEFWDGDIDWYAPAEIADQIYLTSSQRKITEQGYNHSSAKMLPVGTVLFTSRAGIGKTAILGRKGCTNQGFQSIVPHKEELDSYFIFSRADELKQYGETVGAGSTFAEVSGKQMANMELMMPPTLVEQKAIGQYFASLDNLITLHQRKVEILQNIKKSLLEKMFV